MPPRKPRLHLQPDEPAGAADAPQQPPGPKPEEVRAAAAAAAKGLAAGVSTVLADGPPVTGTSGGSGTGGFRAPLPRLRTASPAPTFTSPATGAAAVAAESPTGSAGDNPLASLLGYSDDGESPRSSGGQAGAAGEFQAGPATATAVAGTTSEQQQTQGDGSEGQHAQGGGSEGQQAEGGSSGGMAPGSEPAGAQQHPAPQRDAMDAQLADFLSELESSGLLADNAEQGGSGQQEPAQQEPGQQGASAAVDGVAQPEGVAAGSGASTDAAAAVGSGGGSGGDGGSSEQRVLGPVEGIEGGGWFLVLDTGSGRQYYWNQQTNEVAWTAPAGAVLPAATAAAAAAVAQQPAAPAGSQKQPEGPREQSLAEPAGAANPVAAAMAPAEAATSAQQQGQGQQRLAAAFLVAPSAAALEAAERIAEQCTEAAGELLDDVPKVVRLAVESQALSALLLLLAQAQHAAVDAGDVAAAFKWSDFEATMQMALSALHSQLQALPQEHAAAGPAAEPAGGVVAEVDAIMAEAAEGPEAERAASRPGSGSGTSSGNEGKEEEEAEEGELLPEPQHRPPHQQHVQHNHVQHEQQVEEAEEPLPPLPLEADQLPAVTMPPLPEANLQPTPAASAPLPPEPPLPGAIPLRAASPGVQPMLAAADDPLTSAAPLFPAAQPPLPGEESAPLPAPHAASQASDSAAAAAAAAAERKKRKAAGGSEAAAGAGAFAGAKKARGSAAAAAAASGSRLGKGAASLINKWQAVAKQVAQEDEEAAAAAEALEDPEARAAVLQAQRRREAEEWRLQQLRTGAADDNANFAPVVGDWRQRVKQPKAAKQGQQEDGAAAAAAGGPAVRAAGATPQTSKHTAGLGGDAVPDLDALSEGLPPGWRAMWDKTHKRIYYGDLSTQVRRHARALADRPLPLSKLRKPPGVGR